MQSIDKFLLQLDHRGYSPFPPTPGRPGSFSTPIEVLQVASSLKWRLFPVLPQWRFVAQRSLLEDATSNYDQLEKWAAEYPGCPFAVATGEASGIFSVEMKGDLGRNSLRALEWDDSDWWQQTLLTSAGDDTGHAFFQWPAEFSRHKVLKQIASGLHLRGENDFVLIPPAVVAGIPQSWINPGVEVARVPQEILDHILALSERQAPGKKLSRVSKPRRSEHAVRSPEL